MQTDLPPPYTVPSEEIDSDSDSDHDPSSTFPHPPTTSTMTIHASKTVRGSNNLLGSTAANETLPLILLKQILSALPQQPQGQGGKAIGMLNININCSTVVMGDRNVIAGGNVAVRPNLPIVRSGAATTTKGESQMVAGAKRKRDGEINEGEVQCEAEKGRKMVKVEEE